LSGVYLIIFLYIFTFLKNISISRWRIMYPPKENNGGAKGGDGLPVRETRRVAPTSYGGLGGEMAEGGRRFAFPPYGQIK
jgi:hypothetical protein